MNKKQLFAFFQQQGARVLLQFLDAAYEEMTTDQREAVFGQTIRKAEPLHVDGASLLTQVRQFQRDSLAYGTWMIPVDERKIIPAYLASLAATTTPEAYAAAALPLVRRDSFESFTNKNYTAALRAANKEPKAHLKAEVKRLQVHTSPRSRK